MSAGAFQIAKYETDKGGLMPIRVQPETLALTIGGVANAAPTGTMTDAYGSARVGGGGRQHGVKARSVTIKFTGTPPAGYKADSPITLPVLTQVAWAGYSKGDTGTYLGTAIVVTGVPTPEKRA
jgi:hypothetical protein